MKVVIALTGAVRALPQSWRLNLSQRTFTIQAESNMSSLALLKSEISKKRKDAQATGGEKKSASATKRWRPKAEIEAERERAYYADQKVQAEKRRKKLKEREDEALQNCQLPTIAKRERSSSRECTSPEKDSEFVAPSTNEARDEEPPLSKQEVVRRLRGLKEPITLFGEEDWDRFNRLRDLELAREDGSKGQRNTFQKKLREMEAKDAEEDVYRYTGAKLPQLDSKKGETKTDVDGNIDEEAAMSSKEDYVHFQIRKYMRLWQSEIDAMSTEERRTRKGRSLEITYEQTKDWLNPLFKLLRKRKAEKKILDALKNIFEAAAEREYVQANSLYLEQLAIGNAPWPMGATMVGIHARAAREKIGEDKIAHVMNDEQTRKYIQAVKRLLTVAQRHFPSSFSKMIL